MTTTPINPYKSFTTDANLETKGVTIEYGPFRVTGARAGGGNKKFSKSLERKLKPYRRQLQTETMDETVADRILQEAFIEGVLRNWEVDLNYGKKDDKDQALDPDWQQGIHDPDTFAVVPLSMESYLKAFKAKPDLFADLRTEFAKASLFRQEEAEADAKN